MYCSLSDGVPINMTMKGTSLRDKFKYMYVWMLLNLVDLSANDQSVLGKACNEMTEL